MNLVRNVLSVILGYAVWTVIFLGGSVGIKNLRSDVFDDRGFTSDFLTLMMYLGLSFVASIFAGFVTARVAATRKIACIWLLALCLLGTGIPVQLSAWNDLPLWYNLAFLIMLIPMTIAGAAIVMQSPSEPTA